MDFREKVISAFGDFPQKAELNFRIISSEDMGDYTRQLVEYNVEKDERVRSFLLLPNTPGGRAPAILAAHQHAVQFHIGKSEVIGVAGNPMYAYGEELCLRGYVVLAPDFLCFEERIPPDYQSRAENDRHYEMFEFVRRVYKGSSLRVKYLHDLTVALDVLENLPFVDNDRIGAVGHSLGGQEATWLMWYDKRVAACVSSCGIGQIDTLFRDNILISLALYAPGFEKLGDTSDIVCGIAPRPYFMTSGRKDIRTFPIDGVELIIKKAKARYAELGKAENFRSIVFDGGHVFNDDVKQEAYNWLDGVLLNSQT